MIAYATAAGLAWGVFNVGLVVYFTKHGAERFGAIPIFDADLAAIGHVSLQPQQARALV